MNGKGIPDCVCPTLLEDFAKRGLAVMFSPMLREEADWTGHWVVYVYGPDPRQREPIKQSDPTRDPIITACALLAELKT